MLTDFVSVNPINSKTYLRDFTGEVRILVVECPDICAITCQESFSSTFVLDQNNP